MTHGVQTMFVIRPRYTAPGYRWDFPLDGTNSPEGIDLTGMPLGKMRKGITVDGDLTLKDTWP
jgi:hypothetical protein